MNTVKYIGPEIKDDAPHEPQPMAAKFFRLPRTLLDAIEAEAQREAHDTGERVNVSRTMRRLLGAALKNS